MSKDVIGSSPAVIQDPIYPVISAEHQKAVEGAVKISFTGDLILLRDMIERAYNLEEGTYDFDEMFEHVQGVLGRKMI